MKRSTLYLVGGYLVGSFFGLNKVLGMFGGKVP